MASPDSAGTDASPPGRSSRRSDTSRRGSGSHRTARRRGFQSASSPLEGDHRFNTAGAAAPDRRQQSRWQNDAPTVQRSVRPAPIHSGSPHPSAGGEHTRQRCVDRRLCAPVETVAEVEFVARLHCLSGCQKQTMLFSVSPVVRDLHQADRPFAPLVTRLNPQAGTLVIPAHHVPGSGRNHGPAAADQSRAGSCPGRR